LSAIQELIEKSRGHQFITDAEEDAAEAELKVFETLEYTVERMHAQLLERDRRDAELREALELYKGHELRLERLVREVFRWATGEGPKAPIAPDREAQVQREAEEFYGRQP
jgi:hypothetical protein